MPTSTCDPWRALTASEIETAALRLPAADRYFSAIAREMRLDPRNVRYFVIAFKLREKIGICEGRSRKSKTENGETKRVRIRKPVQSIGAQGKKYIIAMRALKEAEECVAPSLIARHAAVSKSAVLLWIRSHRGEARKYGAVPEHVYKTQQQVRRYAQLVESGEIDSMNIAEISVACQCNNKTLPLIKSLYEKQKNS